MKKNVIIIIVYLFLGILLTSCSSEKITEFPQGNLKFAHNVKASIISDFQRDGLHIYETYADKYVFSFVADISGLTGFTGEFHFEDKNGNLKYYNAVPWNNATYVISIPNYQKTDKFIALHSQNAPAFEIELSEFFPGITSLDDVKYNSGSQFLYNNEIYCVTDITKTYGYYILNFDREKADPGGLNLTVFDDKLENKSSYFINDYTMYITDFLSVGDCLYFKISDYPDIITIKINPI